MVALSRARRGLYLFGNAITLTAAETCEIGIGRDVLWTPVISELKRQGRFDLDGGLPIICSNHGRQVLIMEADEWLGLAGGCDEDCDGVLPCGHACPLKCHPFGHEMVFCRVPCPKMLACGHGCSHFCSEACRCSLCEKAPEEATDGNYTGPRTGLTSDTRATNNTLGRRPVLGAPSQWRNWDAEKADAEMAEKARQRMAENPGIDSSEVIYNDTWRPISLKNGERTVSQPVRNMRCGGCIVTEPTIEERNWPQPTIDALVSTATWDMDVLMHKLAVAQQDPLNKHTVSKQKGIDIGDGVFVKTTHDEPSSSGSMSRTLEEPKTSPVPNASSSSDLGIISRRISQIPLPYEAGPFPASPVEAGENDDLIDFGGGADFSPVAASGTGKKEQCGVDDLLILD